VRGVACAEDFRSFRPDRIVDFAETGETFVETDARGLAGYLRTVGGGAN
jgi:predicted DNA-binding transcriptional regulator YafY